jgi:succinoglycan biosynthesis protein ExoA
LASREKRRVTVVIACRNENPRILSLLSSLVRLDRANLALDVIIADGMSTDGTRQILDQFERCNSWVTVLDNPERIVATGLNRAIVQARGEFIIRMDAHTSYEPEYADRCVSVLEATGAGNAGGPQRSTAHGFWPRAIHAGFHSPFASGGARFRSDGYCGPTDTVPYGCWRKDFLVSIGLFDESLVRNQDDELNLRIRLAGGTVWQDASIVSWYSTRATLQALFRQYLQFGFWRVAVLRKHPGAAAVRHVVPALAAFIGALLILLSVLKIAAAAQILVVLGFAYAGLSVWASLRAASKEGWVLLPALPITFAVYQAAYAGGFCMGLVYWTLCRREPTTEECRKLPRIFTALSR